MSLRDDSEPGPHSALGCFFPLGLPTEPLARDFGSAVINLRPADIQREPSTFLSQAQSVRFYLCDHEPAANQVGHFKD
jgi:hypothetical protein